jgi:hypothetical protein
MGTRYIFLKKKLWGATFLESVMSWIKSPQNTKNIIHKTIVNPMKQDFWRYNWVVNMDAILVDLVSSKSNHQCPFKRWHRDTEKLRHSYTCKEEDRLMEAEIRDFHSQISGKQPETKKKQRGVLSYSLQGDMPLLQLDFRFQDCRTMRKYISVFQDIQYMVICNGSPRKLI